MRSTILAVTVALQVVMLSSALAGPKGTVRVPRISAPITVDGDFSDWPLSAYFDCFRFVACLCFVVLTAYAASNGTGAPVRCVSVVVVVRVGFETVYRILA